MVGLDMAFAWMIAIQIRRCGWLILKMTPTVDQVSSWAKRG
jgi:hypothetical protein